MKEIGTCLHALEGSRCDTLCRTRTSIPLPQLRSSDVLGDLLSLVPAMCCVGVDRVDR